MGAVLRVSVWQHAAALDPAENRGALAGTDVPAGTDLLVLPEAFARDFGDPGSALAPYAEPLDGPFVGALTGLAARSGAAVLAGMFESAEDSEVDPGRPFNTLALVGPTGLLASYRKIHLYDSFGTRESDVLSPGPVAPVVVDLGGFRVGLMTCYDLRFPELARALSAAAAEVLVVPAAWVAGPGKVGQWQALLRARAIENLCWVVAAAQPGPRYCGHSTVISPTGDVVVEAGEDDAWLSAELDLGSVHEARRTNPSLRNRRM
ncbi:MAG: Nitrilase/cyanide hydratase and apolipoprotein N-acyltransferase [Marmoricola sp.]|nr:Nitrilase/cyanide hydratase and apolipoprotein N-acyltransferase [Marmoricola sp.]